MSFWKMSAVDINAHRTVNTSEITIDAMPLYDSVEELMAEWEKKYIRFSIEKTWIQLALMISFMPAILWVCLLNWALVGFATVIIRAVVVYLISCSAVILAGRISTAKNHKKSGIVYKAKIKEVYPDGIRLNDKAHSFVKWPAQLAAVLDQEYGEKEGAEICIVASETLKFIYGIEYKDQILML